MRRTAVSLLSNGAPRRGITQEVKIVKLAVVTTNTGAIRCYARCGFQVYGIEPQALCYDSVFYDELLMARTI